jgi:Protein of unknown function (DUF3570)
VRSATFETAWYQNIGSKLILVPSLRLYRQSAADFYFISLDGTTVTPSRIPSAAGPHYSSDYRLSKLESSSLGLKLVWTPVERLLFDVAYERYSMRGLDGHTSASAYPSANIVTLGVQRSW